MSSIRQRSAVIEQVPEADAGGPIIDMDKAKEDESYRNAMRHRCETDHFFLAQVMGLNAFVEEIHRDVANLYFPKNRNIPIQQQHHIKRRMHLDPRETGKSTFGRVDSVQWLIAFPERMMMVNATATQPLAKTISASIAKVFWHPAGTAAKPMHVLYPELMTRSEPFRNTDYWDTPGHMRQDVDIDHTVSFTSPQSTQSGWHPWVFNPDDMVDEKNSGIRRTEETRQGIITTYQTNKNTVLRGGYVNMRGTRYHPFELYGRLLETMDQDNPEDTNWKTLIRSAVVLKNGERLDPGRFPKEEDMWLPFAAMGLDYRYCKTLFDEDYESYMCQQQNDPLGGSTPTFSDRLYGSCTIDPERIPTHRDGETYLCWRLPYGTKKETSYLEGAAVRVVDGKVYVIDCWQGTYIPSRLAEKIVDEQKKHQADGVFLFDTPGSANMWENIKNAALLKNVNIPLQWMWWTEVESERLDRMKQMEPMMKSGRIFIATGMTKGLHCRKQFVNFGLIPETGIIECITKLADQVPLSMMRAQIEDEEIEAQRQTREFGLISSLLRQQGMPKVDDMAIQRAKAHAAAMSRATNSRGLPGLPGGLDG